MLVAGRAGLAAGVEGTREEGERHPTSATDSVSLCHLQTS